MRASRRHPNRHLVAIAVGGLLATLGAAPASAANCTWNPASGNWGTAADWSCLLVPGINDDATIAVSKVVTINTAQSIRNLSNAGGVNIDAFLLTLGGTGNTTNTGTINIGGPSTAALQVSAGHDINNTGGVINIGNGSVLNQFGSVVTGGVINATGTGSVVAYNNSSNFLQGVTLNGRLDQVSNFSRMRIINGLTLNGTVDIGASSIFSPQGNQTINGTGTIAFVDASAGNRFAVEAGNLTLGSGITVRGGNGRIGEQVHAGGAATLTNQGLISADVAGRSIIVTVNGSVINQGTMRAQNGGTLQIDNMSGGLNNSAGTLLADNGSLVFFNGVAVSGGTLNSAGSGVFRAANNGNNFLNGVTLNGTLDMASATSIERVSAGGMVLNGTINIGNNSTFAPQGDQTISGTGSIVFADGFGSNRLNAEAGNLTLGSGITVRGGNGRIGDQSYVGGAATLTNNGTIQADVAGRSITITVNGTTTNNGTLAALNGGTLNLDSSIVGGAGSQIVAGAGSVVAQNGVTISGNMNLTGAGSFRPSNSASNFLSGVTLSGSLDMASATGQERVTGGLTLNNASIHIGLNSTLAPQGVQTIGGTGTINFADNSGSNRLNVEAGNLTLGSGITVRGGNGRIGDQSHVGGAATLTNQGLISADVTGRSIIVTVNGSVINQATMKAQDGGTLRIDAMSGGLNNSAGTLLAGNDGVVLFNGVAVTGGTLNSAGSGVFRAANNGNNFLNGVTLNGTLDMASATSIERVSAGGMALNGTINIGNNSTFAPQGDQTISGTGSIVFADGFSSNRLNVEAGNLTLGSGITVRGGNGLIGDQSYLGGSATLTNQGLISADVTGRSIIVAVNGSVINQGTMKAQDGGTLRIDAMSGGLNNSAGTLLADNDGVVLFNGVAVTGGTLNSAGNGVFRADNNGNNLLNGVTLNGTLDMASATSIERISAGGMVLNGTINIGKNSILAPQGVQTISGTGSIVFADASGSNRLNVEAGNLTIGPGVTIRGQNGDIGGQSYLGGAATLTNNGTINADAGGTITINVNGSLANNGTLRAQNGTLLVQDNLSGTGTLRVDPTGSMTLANGGHTQGRLQMGAAGSAINIGNGNLTINNDYTNDAAGTGNSFNRRAGVTGTGQIVAGGDVAQVITGAGVTGGNTTNATLTLGNVRVGANTFNYQIGNAGTVGPTLRGAIQTSVNGGNLTDARLSGSGVTPSNYNAGAPGDNSGDLSVVFTAASAGALAPLAGQVINLRSNFENIADQKLNIVLGTGAAAYNAAVGATTPTPVTLANQRVNGSASVGLTVANTAAPGAFSEDLRATFGTNTGDAQNNGGVASGIVAGSSSGAALAVGVNTATAGAKSGTVSINYETLGTVGGTSNGLGVGGANPAQTINVSGNVYLAAQPSPGSLPAVVNLGNFRAGSGAQNAPAIVVTNTNLAPAGFQEGLTASIVSTSGAAAGSGFVNAAAGSSGNLTVGLSGIAAGNNTGTVDVQLRSSGITTTGDTGLGTLDLGGVQNITVNGTGWRLAEANTIAPINFGNVLVGSNQTRTVSISNLAAADGFSEALNAAFGTIGGTDPLRFSTSGALNGLLAGLTDNATMQVTLSTGSAGAVSANVQILLTSNGTAVGDGLGLTPLPTQVINLDGIITANVGNLAQASLAPANVSFGKFREGAPDQTQQLTIGNTATGPAEGLNASFGASSGGASHNGGSITSLAPGGSDATSMSVSLGGLATAGAKAGSVTVNFVSDGSFNNGTPTNLPSQVVNLAAEVYRLAQGAVAPNLALAARRVGDAGSSAVLTVANTAAADGFSEGLRGTVGAAPAGFSVSGPAATGLIAAGANATRTVTLDTNTAGVFGGNISVALASDGAGTSGFGEAALPGASTAVSGKVYTAAVGAATGTTIDFGVVRVGDTPSAKNIVIDNTAAVTALNDTLRADLSGVSGPFAPTAGSVAGIAAQDSSTIAVGLNTTAAGVFSQTGTVSFLSQNGDMADVSAGGDADVQFLATINALANPVFDKIAGNGGFGCTGLVCTLDFGDLLLGSSDVSGELQLINAITGPADALDGSFDLVDLGAFAADSSGFDPVDDLAPGASLRGFLLGFSPDAVGAYEGFAYFDGLSVNATNPDLALARRTLQVRARVVDSGGGSGTVPEPGTFALLMAAIAAGWAVRLQTRVGSKGRRAATRH